MAFESLTDRLAGVFKKLRGHGKLTEADIKAAMREVRMALLEADVNYKVAKDFCAKVSERAMGQEVMESLTPAQQVVKIVNEELTALMGSENQKIKIAFVNASSAATYGASTVFTEDLKNEGPLNCYGYSKFLFDQVLRARMANLSAPTVNLRFFNVYGPHEQHKGRMASVAFHQYFQFKKDGKVKLFEGCLGYGNGCQMRDFVYVEDVVSVVRYFLTAGVSGIFNCGTGRAQPFNDIALTVVNSLTGVNRTLEEAVSAGLIEYIPFPEALKGKYQAYTQADLSALRNAGCNVKFRSVQEGTAEYMNYLAKTYPDGNR